MFDVDAALHELIGAQGSDLISRSPVVTIEDPIEFLHVDKKSIIN